jgi:hypothetical protein
VVSAARAAHDGVVVPAGHAAGPGSLRRGRTARRPHRHRAAGSEPSSTTRRTPRAWRSSPGKAPCQVEHHVVGRELDLLHVQARVDFEHPCGGPCICWRRCRREAAYRVRGALRQPGAVSRLARGRARHQADAPAAIAGARTALATSSARGPRSPRAALAVGEAPRTRNALCLEDARQPHGPPSISGTPQRGQ